MPRYPASGVRPVLNLPNEASKDQRPDESGRGRQECLRHVVCPPQSPRRSETFYNLDKRSLWR